MHLSCSSGGVPRSIIRLFTNGISRAGGALFYGGLAVKSLSILLARVSLFSFVSLGSCWFLHRHLPACFFVDSPLYTYFTFKHLCFVFKFFTIVVGSDRLVVVVLLLVLVF